MFGIVVYKTGDVITVRNSDRILFSVSSTMNDFCLKPTLGCHLQAPCVISKN